MKTIYELELGDTFYYNNGVGRIFSKTLSTNAVISDFFLRALEHGNVFLTEEDCQRSIDYNVALAKINKRASELYDDEIEQDYCYIDFIHESSNELWFFATHQLDEDEELQGYARRRTGYRLCFDKDICGHLIEELPEECKIVLGVE